LRMTFSGLRTLRDEHRTLAFHPVVRRRFAPFILRGENPRRYRKFWTNKSCTMPSKGCLNGVRIYDNLHIPSNRTGGAAAGWYARLRF